MPVVKPSLENVANIKVIGIGGSGNNALNRMVEANVRGVEFVAINTDAQALHYSNAQTKLHIGQTLTRGLGAGMNPGIGQQAAEESREEIYEIIKGADMVFTTGGFGGGTASGALPVISEIAREAGSLTVAIVTKPFSFEGQQRMTIAEESIADLADKVDASVVVPNDRLLQIIDKKTSLTDAFKVVDDVLRQGVQGITDLITKHGLVNVDFADVRAITENAGSALMGIGRASGENRAADAARAAIESPLLDITIDGARGVIFNITAGSDLRMYEVEEAARLITEHADPNAKVIFGAVIDPESVEEGEVRLTVVATGFDKPEPAHAEPQRYSGSASYSPPQPRYASPFPSSMPSQPQPPRPAQPQQPQQPEEQRPVYGQNEPQRPAAPSGGGSYSGGGGGRGRNEDNESSSDEDLEVPTFIRRKMREQRESRGGEGS